MRILLVLRYFYCLSLPIGGAERQALKLAKELEKNDVQITVATGLWDWGQPRREMVQGIPVHRHFAAWGMFNIKGLRKFGQYAYLCSLFLYLIRHRNEYDVIHCHSAIIGASVVVLAGKLLRKPTLVRSMASGPWGDIKMLRTDRSLMGTGWMLAKIHESDAIVALNEQVVQEMMEIGVTRDKIFCIPNGVQVQPDSRKRDYTRDDPIIITFVGRLHPQKNVATLLRALGIISQKETHLSWRAKLAGTGSIEHELAALAGELSIAQRVEFLGHVADINALLEQSDIFVLPSVSEGMSNALLEAMAHGLPCIVTDIPGNNDVIQDRENGVLTQVDDVEGLARAIIDLANDTEFRKKLGQRARLSVETRYSLPQVASQYIKLYESLLTKSS